jgi:HSP20 family molecular chaperone IbpA
MRDDSEVCERVLEPIWARYTQSAPSREAGGSQPTLRSVSFRHGPGSAPAKIFEDDEKIIVECDVAGSRPDDIDIVLSGRVLAISARGSKPFEESFYVPLDVDLGGMHAELNGNRLHVTLPGRGPARGLGRAWYGKAT